MLLNLGLKADSKEITEMIRKVDLDGERTIYIALVNVNIMHSLFVCFDSYCHPFEVGACLQEMERLSLASSRT